MLPEGAETPAEALFAELVVTARVLFRLMRLASATKGFHRQHLRTDDRKLEVRFGGSGDTPPLAATAHDAWPTPIDDSLYLSDSFERFLRSRRGAPFLAQISFHNCHIPFLGTPEARKQCADGVTCRPAPEGAPYTEAELDYLERRKRLLALTIRAIRRWRMNEIARVFDTWRWADGVPDCCKFGHVGARRAAELLRGKHIAFVGDSQSRRHLWAIVNRHKSNAPLEVETAGGVIDLDEGGVARVAQFEVRVKHLLRGEPWNFRSPHTRLPE